MTNDNISLNDLIAAYHAAEDATDIRAAIEDKIATAHTFLNDYRMFLTDENVKNLKNNIRKAEAAINGEVCVMFQVNGVWSYYPAESEDAARHLRDIILQGGLPALVVPVAQAKELGLVTTK